MKTMMICAMTILLTGSVCFADSENLSRRIERLERELEQLKSELAHTEPAQREPQLNLNARDTERLEKMVRDYEPARRNVWSSLDIGIYGYLKLDASYDTAQTSLGNFARWVLPGDEFGRREFNMTANETRIGLDITGPTDGQMLTSGKLEVDFYGSNADQNKAKLMMRHAYLQLDWPEDQFSIIAGQTWDVISPRNPQTLNTGVLWWSGNVGYRRPQIRLTQGFGDSEGTSMTLAGAVARTIGRDDFIGRDSGAASGYPSLQGRVGFEVPIFEPGRTSFGFSGHWGRERYDTNATDTESFKSWSANFDFHQPINEWLGVQGALFMGENLNAYLGGIGQGVNLTTNEEISAKGGWIAARFTPIERWTFNIGGGIDDVDSGDIETGDRKLNRSVFGNAIYALGENTSIGFELSHWRTEYQGTGDQDNLRAQGSFIYRF